METVRSAGYNERRCITRDVLGLYGYIVTLATYRAPSIPPVSDVYGALRYCISQHPVLSIVIQDAESKHPMLANATRIDLRKHVRYLDSADEDATLEARLRSSLNIIHNEPPTGYGQAPQWRTWVITRQTLSASSEVNFQVAFACSHALADGISGLAFHRSFLQGLANSDGLDVDVSPVLNAVYQNQLPLPLERAAALPISWSFLLRPALAEYLPAFLAQTFGLKESGIKDAWLGSPTRPNLPPPTKLLPTAIDVLLVPQATLQKIIGLCRENDARLTGLLTHLTTRALAYCLRTRHQPYARFIAETAIDLRKCMSKRHNLMANYVSATEEILDAATIADPTEKLEPEDWQAIRHTTKRLSKASSTLSDQPVGLLTYLSDYRKWTLSRASETAKVSFGVSNVGAFAADQPVAWAWKITEMTFSQSADATGSPLNINVVSVKDGPLAITLTWWPGMLGVEDEKEFVKDILKTIDTQLGAVS